jgi:hypothetical protein
MNESFKINRRYPIAKTVEEYKQLVVQLLFKNDGAFNNIDTNNYVQRSDELKHLFENLSYLIINTTTPTNNNNCYLFKNNNLITYANIINDNYILEDVDKKENAIYILIYINYTIYFKCNDALEWIIIHIERNNYYDTKIIQDNYTVNYDFDGLLIVQSSVKDIVISLPNAELMPKKLMIDVTIKKASTNYKVNVVCENDNTIDLITQNYELKNQESITITPIGNTNWIIR